MGNIAGEEDIEKNKLQPLEGIRGIAADGGAYYIHSRPSWQAAGLPDFCRTLFRIERQELSSVWVANAD